MDYLRIMCQFVASYVYRCITETSYRRNITKKKKVTLYSSKEGVSLLIYFFPQSIIENGTSRGMRNSVLFCVMMMKAPIQSLLVSFVKPSQPAGKGWGNSAGIIT